MDSRMFVCLKLTTTMVDDTVSGVSQVPWPTGATNTVLELFFVPAGYGPQGGWCGQWCAPGARRYRWSWRDQCQLSINRQCGGSSSGQPVRGPDAGASRRRAAAATAAAGGSAVSAAGLWVFPLWRWQNRAWQQQVLQQQRTVCCVGICAGSSGTLLAQGWMHYAAGRAAALLSSVDMCLDVECFSCHVGGGSLTRLEV